MTKLIEKNTTIPTSKKETFSTAADNQTSVTIHALQGEREFANDNRSLGRFDLSGIAPAPRGLPQVEVEFAIDANGILNVTATDKATSKKQEIRITGSSGLSKEEVERMRKEAEENATADKVRRELIDLRNQGESVAYSTRKSLEEHGDKISSDARGRIEGAISNLETALKGEDKAAMQAALKTLNDASAELGKAVYEATSKGDAKATGAAKEAGAHGKDDVIDAEYEVKDGN